MNSDSTKTADILDLLAISGDYIGMGADPVVACRDRSVEPFGDFSDSDPPFRDDTESLGATCPIPAGSVGLGSGVNPPTRISTCI